MRLSRSLLVLTVLLLHAAWLTAGQPKINNMLVFHDDVLGKDTVLQNVYLNLRNLYTDSLIVGYAPYDENGAIDTDELRWVPQDKVSYFRYNRHLYAPLTLTTDSGSVTCFMRHYRDRLSRVKVYTMGNRRHRQYYALYPDSTVLPIADMVEFRDQERLERTGNHNFIRSMHWGVLAGMMGNGAVQLDDYPPTDAQQAVTAGVWMDYPFLRHGTSLHVKALYHALSAQTQRRGVAWAYNRRGIDLPLTLRYTCLHVPYRVIPFVEGGMNFRFSLRTSLDGLSNQYVSRPDGQYYPSGELATVEQSNSSMSFAPVVGGGLRYRISDTRHAMLTFNYYFNSVLSHFPTPEHATYSIGEVSTSGWALTLAVGLW